MMIQSQHIQKYYGAELVLIDVSFEIKEGEKVGLIGRNGSGKTTMMKLISGTDTPDQGTLAIRRNARIGALAQIPDYGNGETVYHVLQSAFHNLLEVREEMQRLEAEMSASDTATNPTMLEALLRQYGHMQDGFERGGGYEIEASIDRVAGGLGIPVEQYQRPFSTLSGGEKTKVGLAVILLQSPDILLLDEPTNHLDMSAIEWLESFLGTYSGTAIITSHDRYFLDAVAAKIIEIEDGEAITYHCNYSKYKEEKEARLLQQFAEYQEQQKKIQKMKETIKQLIEWGNRSNPPNPGFHRRAASMQKALDRMVKLKRPVLERKRIDLQLQQSDRSGKDALVLTGVSKSIGNRQLYSEITHTLRYGETAALVGGNGSGKSTLLKCILGMAATDKGEIRLGSRTETGYLAQESAPSDLNLTVLEYFRNEIGMETGEARNQLARFLFYGADVFKQVCNLSGGEWTRLRLTILMYRKPNLLLLDEPTNHLDIDSREALEDALEEFPGTVLAVSHDRYFINKIARQVWALENEQMNVTLGNFEDFRAELEKRKASTSFPNETSVAKHNLNSTAKPQQSKQLAKPPQTSSTPNPATIQKLERDMAELEQTLNLIQAAMLEPEAAYDSDRLSELQTQQNQVQLQLDGLIEKYIQMLEDDDQ